MTLKETYRLTSLKTTRVKSGVGKVISFCEFVVKNLFHAYIYLLVVADNLVFPRLGKHHFNAFIFIEGSMPKFSHFIRT
jgi:hypothetical protein